MAEWVWQGCHTLLLYVKIIQNCYLIITLNSQSSTLNWQQSQLCLVQFCQQLHALTVEVDVALELLVDAVYLYVIDEGGDFALLQSFVEERERLLEELYVAVVDDLLKSLQLLVFGAH